MNADRIFVNGRVATLDAEGRVVQAVATWRGRIVALGSDGDVLDLRGPRTPVIDLYGRLVLPGFTDSHIHFLSFSLHESGRYLDMREAASLEQALQMVRRRAESLPPGEWIRGGRWDKNHWPTDAFPTRWDLDEVTPRNPALLSNKDGHSVWVNSIALAAGEVTKETPTPEGGAILRDSSGEPTGILQDAAIGLVGRCLPQVSSVERREALIEGMRAANALGLTGIHNCEGPEVMASLQGLAREELLTLRVVSHVAHGALDHAIGCGLRSGFGDEWHQIGGVKLFVDGALGSQTAAMLEPLEGSENRGLLQMSREELASVIRRATEAGISCAVHAIGDRANRLTLNAFDEVARLSAEMGLSHSIEHAQHLTVEDIPRFAHLGVTASVQPVHICGDIDIVERRLGQRSRWAYPFASLLRSGANLAFGSDAPVESPDPLQGIHAAVNRKRRDGTPRDGWHPEERLSVEEAARCYTVGAASAVGLAHDRGSLEAGKLADFVVLSDDIFALPPSGIKRARVERTVVGGEVVFQRDD